ncbi:hypothetical protein FNO01nite_28430 [Flavobacterium noncentrifugens]|uniref:hypothetical protein n=1 Tax=Flavobacterium noncentrifugens TaxID=1128970 RepID=UPI000B81F027|nr:hypothetical protein [Flavobacterium noncentrifugens]GEP52171.1 hypothetical protein FNO01nite_28430 [Flavobacterium noncentrifugens]
MSLIPLTIYTFWFASEILINRLMRSKMQDQSGKDKNSLALIWATIIIGMTLSITIAIRYPFSISTSVYAIYLGLFLILAGVIFRAVIVKSLGAFFTADVTIRGKP